MNAAEDLPQLDYAAPESPSFRKTLNVVLALICACGCGLFGCLFVLGVFINLLKWATPNVAAATACGILAVISFGLASIFIWKFAVYRRPNTRI